MDTKMMATKYLIHFFNLPPLFQLTSRGAPLRNNRRSNINLILGGLCVGVVVYFKDK